MKFTKQYSILTFLLLWLSTIIYLIILLTNSYNQTKVLVQENLVSKQHHNSKPPPRRKLEYIHITKTGGSAIEHEASIQQNITWGACHYLNMTSNGNGCNHPDIGLFHKYNESNIPLPSKGINIRLGEPWHTPPHWLLHNPFENDDTFTVVRNPYSRTVSHYYCKYKGYTGKGKKGDKNNATIMNEWIQDLMNLTKIKIDLTHHDIVYDDQHNLIVGHHNLMKKNNLILVHFLPQHYYVYDKDGQKIIDHVLKNENLNQEFSMLMNEYGINITLPQTKWNGRSSDNLLTHHDLDNLTISMINDLYHDDFHRFNYTKIQIHS